MEPTPVGPEARAAEAVSVFADALDSRKSPPAEREADRAGPDVPTPFVPPIFISIPSDPKLQPVTSRATR